MQEAFDNSIDLIKRFLLDVTKAILQKSGEIYLKNTRLSQILQPVFQIIEAEELKNKDESNVVFEENFEEKAKKDENNEENSKSIVKSPSKHEESAEEEYEENAEENAEYPNEEEEEEA